MWTDEQDREKQDTQKRKAGQDSKIGRTGGRTGQAKLDGQNWTGITRLTEKGCQDKTAREG
jgi:hypothetical protein